MATFFGGEGGSDADDLVQALFGRRVSAGVVGKGGACCSTRRAPHPASE